MKSLFAKIILVLVLLSSFAGCIQQKPTGYKSQNTPGQEELRIAAATSACNPGLLDTLNKKFEETNNVKIITTCEGTGKAIAAGELGEVDVVMAQSIPDELQAVANGSFINRRYIMYNYFVIVGPGVCRCVGHCCNECR